MPWECKKCLGGDLRDDAVCPTCSSTKASWTMVPEKTRTFTLGGKKFELLRGASDEAWPAGDPRHEAEVVVVAEQAPVMTREAAARVPADHLPPSRRVLRVRLHPKSHKDLTVLLSVNFGQLEVRELELPFEGEPVLRPDGSLDVLVLLVHGPGADPTLPGVHVVDVGEETARGYAPAIEVKALGKPAREVPTEEPGARVWLSARFFDRAGRAPLADRALKVEGRDARTDERGAVVLPDMPWRDLVVSFDEGEVRVPAVHDATILTRVCLRFVEAKDEVEGEAKDEDAAAADPEVAGEELAYPAWLPRPDDPLDDDDDEPDPWMTGDWVEDDDLPDEFELVIESQDEEDEEDAAPAAGGQEPADEDFELVVVDEDEA